MQTYVCTRRILPWYWERTGIGVNKGADKNTAVVSLVYGLALDSRLSQKPASQEGDLPNDSVESTGWLGAKA